MVLQRNYCVEDEFGWLMINLRLWSKCMKLVAKTIASRKYFDKIYKIHENKPIKRLKNNKNLHKNEKCISFECRRHFAACSEVDRVFMWWSKVSCVLFKTAKSFFWFRVKLKFLLFLAGKNEFTRSLLFLVWIHCFWVQKIT